MNEMSQMESMIYIGNLTVPKNLCNLDDLREAICKSLGGDLFKNNHVHDHDHEDVDDLSQENNDEISQHEDENEKQNNHGEAEQGLHHNENIAHAKMGLPRNEVQITKNPFDKVGENPSLVEFGLYDEAKIQDEEMDTEDQMNEESKLEFLVIKPEILEKDDDNQIFDDENIGYHFLTQLQQAIDKNKNEEHHDLDMNDNFCILEDSDSDIPEPEMYHCPLCNYSKTYQLSVKRHIYIHHPEIDSHLPPGQRLSCDICNKRYYDSRHFQKHMKSSHDL